MSPLPVEGDPHPPVIGPGAVKPVTAKNVQLTKTASAAKKPGGWRQWAGSHKTRILGLVVLVLAIVYVGWLLWRPHEVMVT